MALKHFVFVYGTLLKDDSNHRLLAYAKQVAESARTKGKLFDTGFGYPAIMRHTDEYTHGELYEVDDETLRHLDELEDYIGENDPANLYDRIIQEVETEHGTRQAYVYLAGPLLNKLEKEILGGDWRQHRMSK